MKSKILYTTSFGRKILKTKRNLSLLLHGKKKNVDMDLYVGDLLWSYNGQPTISQYYLAARYLDAKLVKEGIFDKSYCEELSRAYRGTVNSKEKTIDTMKKFKVFLDNLEKEGFNPTLGRFSIANDPNGLFFDDGTHRLAGLLLNKVKYIPVRIEDRRTKYDLNGRDILSNSPIDKDVFRKIEEALKEIKNSYRFDLFVLIKETSSQNIYTFLRAFGELKPLTLINPSVNKKVRKNEIPTELLGIIQDYKDSPHKAFRYSITENHIFFKKDKLLSLTIDECIINQINNKKWGIIIPSLTESIKVEMYLSMFE